MSDVNDREDLSTADIASAGRRREEERAAAEEAWGQKPEPAAATRERGSTAPAPLFDPEDAGAMRSHWDEVQAAFVDDPRQAVQHADSLVAEVVKRLADSFAEERSKLEEQWGRGENVSTEDLRVALQRYRSFFDRLLSI